MAQIDAFFKLMNDEGASDLHMMAGQQPVLRIRGDMERVKFKVLENEMLKSMLYEICPEDRIKIFEETGDMDFAYELPGLARYRCNFFQQKYGIGAVFREIPSEILTCEQLGLPKVVSRLSSLPKGLVLITGPTGSGKSTTLAAVIDECNKNRKDHIITVEDPIEFVHRSQNCIVNHREVGTHTRSFSAALRGALREDPDIILVGEVRDKDTAEMAFRAAMTGHQVFSTLHTNSALRSFQRIKDLGVSPEVMAGNIIGIVAQRLVRRVCVHCREEVQVTEGSIEARLIGAHAVGRTVYRAHHGGCEACGFQGYKGRLAIMELLRMDSMLDELITRNATLGELTAHAMAHGFAPMAEDGLRRVLEGITTVEEVGRVVDLTTKL